MRALGDYLQVKCHACVGGTSVREDQRLLQVMAKIDSLPDSWNDLAMTSLPMIIHKIFFTPQSPY